MFPTLLIISMVWLATFIASAAFDVWFEVKRPRFFTETVFGRALTAIGIAPLILTIGITALASLPVAAFMDALSGDPWGEDRAWLEASATVYAAYEWFTHWAPAFVVTGEE